MNQLRLDLGLGSALGFGGLVYARHWTSWLQAEAGVGYGLTGLQLSFMPKLMLEDDGSFITLGVGPAAVVGQKPIDGQTVQAWLNYEIGFESHSRSGFVFYVAFGGTTVLVRGRERACGSWVCTDLSPGTTSLQGRVGFGYAF